MSEFFKRLNEGGPLFMYTILFVLILIIILIVYGVINKRKEKSKIVTLISQLGWFVLFWGIMGQTIGLIMAFDSIEAMGNVSTQTMAGGLKISLLSTLFGTFSFLVSRLGIIFLTLLKK